MSRTGRGSHLDLSNDTNGSLQDADGITGERHRTHERKISEEEHRQIRKDAVLQSFVKLDPRRMIPNLLAYLWA